MRHENVFMRNGLRQDLTAEVCCLDIQDQAHHWIRIVKGNIWDDFVALLLYSTIEVHRRCFMYV